VQNPFTPVKKINFVNFATCTREDLPGDSLASAKRTQRCIRLQVIARVTQYYT
jgi:hypothetical protein